MITEETIRIAQLVGLATVRKNTLGWAVANCWGVKCGVCDVVFKVAFESEAYKIRGVPDGFIGMIKSAPDPKMELIEIVSRRIARDVCAKCNGTGFVKVLCECPLCDGEHLCKCGGDRNEEGQRVYVTSQNEAREIGVQAAFGDLLEGYDLILKEWDNVPIVCAYSDGNVVAFAAALKAESVR